MKCPICSIPIRESGAFCTGCGAAFSDRVQTKINELFSLRRQWDELTAISGALSQQILKLSDTIGEIEQSIALDLPENVTPRADEANEIPEPAAVEKPVSETQASFAPQTARLSDSRQEERAKGDDFAEKLKKQVTDPEFRIGQKALLFVGIITMVFGIAYFLKYSFDQGWIGPAGRVALAYLWALLFLIVGHVIKQKRLPAFGLTLFGGGIAVLYFATYAAFQIYHLLPQTIAFGIMVLITVLACAMAIAYETQALAILGLIGGFATPILLSSDQNNYGMLFSYMTLLNTGILAISSRKRWVSLQYIGFAATWMVFSGWYMQNLYGADLTQFWTSLAFVNVFYLFYSIIPFCYHFTNREKHDLTGLIILIPNSVFVFAYNYFMIEERYPTEWVSLVTVAYALLFLIFASIIYRQGELQRQAFVVMLLKSTFLLILTVPLFFSRHWIVIFWALQAGALLEGSRKLSRNSFFVASAGLLMLALGKFTLFDLHGTFGFGLNTVDSALRIDPSFGYRMIERWFTELVLAATLYQFLRRTGKAGLPFFEDGGRSYMPFFAFLFGVFIFCILTGETSSFFNDYLRPARPAAISVIWAFFSMVLMVLGFKRDKDKLRKIALGLLFATLLKVFIYDISNISTPYRIVSLIVLGIIMILISYFYNKAKQSFLETQKAEERNGT